LPDESVPQVFSSRESSDVDNDICESPLDLLSVTLYLLDANTRILEYNSISGYCLEKTEATRDLVEQHHAEAVKQYFLAFQPLEQLERECFGENWV
jgi:hypothetical protein